MVDAIRVILTNIERTGAEGDDTFAPLRATLQALKDGEAVSVVTSEVVSEELGGAVELSAASVVEESQVGAAITESTITENIATEISAQVSEVAGPTNEPG